MSLISLNYLRRTNLKSLCYRLSRQLSGKATPAEVDRGKAITEEIPKATADPSLVQFSPSWPVDEEPELRAAVARDMQVFPDFITEKEEQLLMDELEPVLKKMRYEFDHWDDAIHGYKETERGTWQPHNGAIMWRVLQLAFDTAPPLPAAHVLDLAPAGHIKPHVDAVRFCGDVIAGICLCSTAVMRLQHSEHKHREVDALLMRRGLYVMKGTARYSFTHEVLGGERSAWRGELVPRRRRVAVIVRSQPNPHAPEPAAH